MIITRTESLLNFKAYIEDVEFNTSAMLEKDGYECPLRILAKSNKWKWNGSKWETNSIFVYSRFLDKLDTENVAYRATTTPLLVANSDLCIDSYDGSGHTLRDYQVDEVERMMEEDYAICGDQQGTGKMIIGCKLAEVALNRTILVVPNQVLYEWHSQLLKWLKPGKSIQILDKLYFKNTSDVELDKDITLIPYSMLTKVYKNLHVKPVSYHRVIIDESHNLSNSKTGRGSALSKILKEFVRVDSLYDMSGTLIKNSPVELQGMMEIRCIRNLMEPLGLFKDEVLGMELESRWIRGKEQTYYGPCSTDEYYLDKTREFLESINYRRRLRSEVMDIPAKLRQVVNVTKLNYGKADTKVMETADFSDDNYFALCHKMALKKVKTPEFKQWFLDTVDKTVVFYKHNDVLMTMIDYLRHENITYAVIAGGVDELEIKKRVDSFQLGDIEVIFIYLDKTEGLTCTAATSGIFVELPDTIKSLAQAEDRIFRFGLDHVGTLYFPVDYNGAESRRLEILRNKAVYIKSLEKNNDTSSLERDVLNKGV